MFPNIRLMIVTVLAAILGIGCGLGLFATFRVNHEPLARLSEGGAPLQLAWEKVTPGPRSSTLSVGYPLAGAAKPIAPPQSPPPDRADAETAPPAPSAAAMPGSDQIAGDTAATPAPKADSQTDLAVAPPAEPSEPPARPGPAAETVPGSDAAASDVPAAEATPAPAAASAAQPAPAAGATTPTAEAAPAIQTENAPAPSVTPAVETPSITSAATPIPEAAPVPAPAPPAETASPATADVPAAEKVATVPATETARNAAAAPATEPPPTTEAASVAAAAPSANPAPTKGIPAAEVTATGSAPNAEAAPAAEATPAAEAAPGTEASQGAPDAPTSSEEGTAKPAQSGASAALTNETPEKPAPSANPAHEDHKAAAKVDNKRAAKREVQTARPAPPPAHRPIIKLTRPRTTRTVVAAPAGELFSQPAYQWTDTATQTPQTVRRVVIRPRRILLRKTAPQSSRQSSATDQGSAANTGEW